MESQAEKAFEGIISSMNRSFSISANSLGGICPIATMFLALFLMHSRHCGIIRITGGGPSFNYDRRINE